MGGNSQSIQSKLQAEITKRHQAAGTFRTGWSRCSGRRSRWLFAPESLRLGENPDHVSLPECTSLTGSDSLQKNKCVAHQHTLTGQSCGFLVEIKDPWKKLRHQNPFTRGRYKRSFTSTSHQAGSSSSLTSCLNRGAFTSCKPFPGQRLCPAVEVCSDLREPWETLNPCL